ncbi:hypothetical protein MBLNU457_5091t1 [Dothideomycetes sp. NU457]
MPRPKKNAARDDLSSRPVKRTKLLSDNEDSDSDADGDNGVALPNGNSDGSLKINQEYAKRFEHNKQREEKHRLEEKYKRDGKNLDDDSDDSSDEDEDDLAEFATEELDNEIFSTLNALKSKDPRIYDPKSTFYRPFDAEAAAASAVGKEKPMTIRDYHRQNILSGHANGDTEDTVAPPTYDQEQENLRKSMISQMNAAEQEDDEENDGDEGFLVTKSKHVPKPESKRKAVELDIEGAEKDPERFLSNFMAARAWVPDEGSRFAHLESDDDDADDRADEFEAAYNLRFEDPAKSNEKLLSYGRDLAKHSVRKEEMNPRKRQREREREIAEQAKQERRDEKARLKRAKVSEIERKVQQIKEAAGLGPGDVVDLDEWRDMLEGDWDDEKWEAAMEKKFGQTYYAEQDATLKTGDDDGVKKSKKLKKPTWDDDIDIKDVVSDYDEDASKPALALTDEEEADQETAAGGKPEKRKSRKEQAADRKRAARQERLKIEEMVDDEMDLDLPQASNPKKQQGQFRYRETSPISFGLTARDILFADDTQLNEFAGIKKHHAFRDQEKKDKDKKKLGKKARLRQWRKETFGNEEGFAGNFASFVRGKAGLPEGPLPTKKADSKTASTDAGADAGKKKRRSRKKKAAEAAV